MKNACLMLVASILGGLVATGISPVEAQRFAGVKKIQAEEIVLSAPGTDRTITLLVNKEAAGMWIQGAKQRIIALCDVRDYSAIGMFADSQRSLYGYNVAMAVDDTGPFMQWVSLDNKIFKHRGLKKSVSRSICPPTCDCGCNETGICTCSTVSKQSSCPPNCPCGCQETGVCDCGK